MKDFYAQLHPLLILTSQFKEEKSVNNIDDHWRIFMYREKINKTEQQTSPQILILFPYQILPSYFWSNWLITQQPNQKTG